MAEQALRQLEFDLIEPFLWSVVFDARTPHERDSRPASAIVRRVEDWLDGQSPEKLQLVDVCRAVHVSRRTLQRAFNETLGIGPTRYFTLKRLKAVRLELRRSDPATVTVTEIAGKYGFWELGRFARDYKQVFRERPSETLRRSSAPSARVASVKGTSASGPRAVSSPAQFRRLRQQKADSCGAVEDAE
jgi:AraC-like DNA-binding protein